jgi:hypothetical protein
VHSGVRTVSSKLSLSVSRIRTVFSCAVASCAVTVPVCAQRVFVRGATHTAVTEAVGAYLQPQCFILIRSDSTRAVFALDRGMMAQQNMFHGRHGNNLFRVVMELHLQFRPKAEGVEVGYYEDVVVLDNDSSLVERRRVTTHSELDNLRRLMDAIRVELEPRAPQLKRDRLDCTR